jgi:adenylate cyclase
VSYTDEELARKAGVAPKRIAEMREAGIFSTRDGVFTEADIQRARMADAFDEGGLSLEALGRLIAKGDYSMDFVDAIYANPVPMAGITFAELVEELGMPLEFARRAFAIGYQLPLPEDDHELREDEAELLRLGAMLFHMMGGDIDVAMASARPFGNNIRRLAEGQMNWFRTYVEDRMLAEGKSIHEVMALGGQMGSSMLSVADRAVVLMYRRQLERYGIADSVLNTEMALAQAGEKPHQGPRSLTLAFVDLSGFTSLTQALGDEAAADAAARLAELAFESTARVDGSIVKLAGDGVMLKFADPSDGLGCCLDLVGSSTLADLPSMHAGLAYGPVVERDGDCFGNTVNLAARISGHAEPGEVLVSGPLREAVDPTRFVWDELGAVTLKGVNEPEPLFRARARDRSAGPGTNGK